MLTLQERIYVIQCYGLGETSIPEVIRLFHIKFPNTVLLQSTVSRLVQKFVSTGSVHNLKKKKNIFDENDAATLMALDSLEENHTMSLRKRSAATGISKTHLQRIYKSNNVRPYKAKFLHTLEEGDEARRLEFCLTLGEKILEHPNIHKFIVFSDESIFTTNGIPSSQNCRYWDTSNPNYVINCRRQYFKKVNTWCAVSYHYGIIGPYFIEGKLNQHTYLNILHNFLDDLPIQHRNSLYFQHDGCPAHSTLIIREWLNEHFGERWIGKYGSLEWSPRSPDLSIMDFFVWGRIKQIVYSQQLPNDIDILKNCIRDAINSITIEEVRAAFTAFRKRIEKCADKGGALIE